MSLKKASIISVLALAVSVSAVSAVSAAPVSTKVSVVAAKSLSYTINGSAVNLDTLFQNGKTLVSLRGLSTKLGAKLQTVGKNVIQATLNGHTVELQADSSSIKVDGTAQKLTVPVKSIKGTTYVELKAFVEALGGNFTKDKSGLIWIDANLLGNVDHIQWANATKFIASQENETGRVDFLINAQTGEYEQLLVATDDSDLVVSPSGAKAAYTNAVGEIFVIDLNTKAATKVSSDNNIMPELVWSSDSSALYFLQGDKGSLIAKIDLATSTITKVLEDKVDYKANLGVSANGNLFTYTVTKPGAIVDGANKATDEEDFTINVAGTEPQIYLFDASVKDGKPAQLTTASDDKVFIEASMDGANVYYVSIGADEASKATLVAVSKDKVVKTLFADQDVFSATFSDGKWYLLTSGTGTNQNIYEVEPSTGVSKLLYTVGEGVTDLIVKAGTVVVINNGKTFVNVNGLWKPTTK
jgi:dipeptidyl aminopeptidase/acylaminoacyl peptidase